VEALWLTLEMYLQNLFSLEDIKRLETAYAFAYRAHTGKFRDGGSPYITHPVESVIIAIEAGERDVDILIALLLHDVYEETADKRYPITFHHVHKAFGQLVAYRVHVMTKYDHSERGRVTYWSTVHKCADHGVKKAKISDRTHNIETLEGIREEERRKWKIEETVREFVPMLTWLANDTMIKTYKTELERHAELTITRNLYRRLKRTMEEKYNTSFLVPELD
jgi:guanosine-3',5'-bis(diphosphate) 3'-pyrophosphohydrolase